MKRFVFVLCILLSGMLSAAYGAHSQPLEELRGPIEEGLAILKDGQYAKEGKISLQREKIWALVQQVFDFNAISRRALARNWRKFDAQQQEEFTTVFTELLKNTYLDKIQGKLHNEEVVFLGQDMTNENKAVVRSKVLRGKLEIPMDYSVYLSEGKWRVYDVKIEGVSLVKNYRVQFRNALSKESPDQLIQRLKEKNQEQAKDRKAAEK